MIWAITDLYGYIRVVEGQLSPSRAIEHQTSEAAQLRTNEAKTVPGQTPPWMKNIGSPDPTSSNRRRTGGESRSTKCSIGSRP